MNAPAIPENEELRLAVLNALQIMDTPLEERFERITRLLTKIFDVPMAGLSFVDENRQWLKSVQGSSVVEIPREYSFCTHTILQSSVMVVEDALLDPRFSGNPLLKSGQGVRFYAGAPLTLDDGIRVGALCICDIKPRKLSDDDIVILQDFATTALNELKARLDLVSQLKAS